MNEDKNEDPITPSPSEEKIEENPEAPKPEDDPTDIDFKKEAEKLENKTPPAKPKRTPQEEVSYNLKKIGERARELGVDPNEVLGITPEEKDAPQGDFVTREDFAENFARTLSGSEDELKVIMWHYRHGIQKSGNIHEDIENAHLLANKGKLKNTFAEMRRKVTPGAGAGESSGQRPKVTVAPDKAPDHVVLTRRGYKLVKPGLYQAKFNQKRYDEATKVWVDEKISR